MPIDNRGCFIYEVEILGGNDNKDEIKFIYLFFLYFLIISINSSSFLVTLTIDK